MLCLDEYNIVCLWKGLSHCRAHDALTQLSAVFTLDDHMNVYEYSTYTFRTLTSFSAMQCLLLL